MADDQDKSQQTEDPTAKRLEQARESGDVVKSPELTAFLLLGGGTLAIAMFGKYTALGLARALSLFLEEPEAMSVDGTGLAAMMHFLLPQIAMTLAPFFAVMVAAGLAGHLLQSRPGFAVDKILPDFSKVSPMAGFKRLFGAEGWMNLLKGLAKMAIVGVAIWTQLWPERGGLEGILDQSTAAVAADMTRLLFKVLMASLSALGVIAGLDYFWQRLRFMSRNRMSKQ
jgi:flagellar biosynthesis protein FlhB